MKDYKVLEALIKDCLEHYKEGFAHTNPELEIDFQTTCTTHNVDVQGMNRWVAYLRLERAIRPKGGSDDEWENILIYNNAYKFQNVGERTDPRTLWKYDLYLDLVTRLMLGGIEYGELLRRMKMMAKGNEGKAISEIVTPEEPKIIITDQMPKPLTDEEKQYQEWVKKNR